MVTWSALPNSYQDFDAFLCVYCMCCSGMMPREPRVVCNLLDALIVRSWLHRLAACQVLFIPANLIYKGRPLIRSREGKQVDMQASLFVDLAVRRPCLVPICNPAYDDFQH